jgi:hypothetical protein
VDLWVSANVNKFDADIASHLKKGDILHRVSGKPVMRPYGEDKLSFELENSQLVIPAELFSVLRERGWTPGGGDKKPAGKVPSRVPSKKAPARKVIDIDDELDGDE